MTGVRQDKLVPALEALIAPADRVVFDGDNQKQADFLSRSLVQADPAGLAEIADADLSLLIRSCPLGLLLDTDQPEA